MKAALDFAFLSIAPVPGLAQLKYQSLSLLCLSICEVLALLVDSASWALVSCVLVVTAAVGVLYRWAWKSGERGVEMEISKVKQLARVVLVLKLLLLSLILAICAHKALSLNCVQSDLTACEQQAQWWTLSTSALLCEGVLAVLGAALVLCMLAQVSKVALELRFRSLSHYLEF